MEQVHFDFVKVNVQDTPALAEQRTFMALVPLPSAHVSDNTF